MNEEQTPKVEGTKEDTGFINFNHCDESCRVCGEVTHNVPTSRVSLCAHCGSEMFPCSGCNEACEGNCTWDKENFKCERFAYSQEWKKNYLQLSRVGFADTLAQLEDILSQRKEWTIQDFEAKYNNAKAAIENIDRQLAEI